MIFKIQHMHKLSLFIISTSLIGYFAVAQKPVSIPAFTGYALPVEEGTDTEESILFSEKDGLHNWTDTKQTITYYCNITKPGKIYFSVLTKNNITGNKIKITFAGKTFSLNVPKSTSFVKSVIYSADIKTPGFYSLVFSAVAKKGKTIAAIKAIELSGPAAEDIHFNAKPRRNAASVHLRYPMADSMKVISFYNEITVPAGSDVLHSYFMACGFARGYFGIQVNSLTERRVIFSVWDAGDEAIDRNKVADENKVMLKAKGEEIFADGFGNEGTGGHSHWVYNWKAAETYKFLVTAATDSASTTTSYAGYFFVPETQNWKLIACFKAPKDGKPLRSLYSFVENFWGNNGQLHRKAIFSNPWIRRENGDWKEIAESKFSTDATGRAGDRIDIGAGIENNQFYLWNGGYVNANAKPGDTFTRKDTAQKPVIDLYKNADSVVQWKKDYDAISNYKLDEKNKVSGTWENHKGISYTILKEGNGRQVKLEDTLVVHYKGTLLDGFIFDQTKEKPATFPLKRLIRGWQYVLPFCKLGGKIRFILPSALAYSIRNLGSIPPNNPLVFEVEVVDIKNK